MHTVKNFILALFIIGILFVLPLNSNGQYSLTGKVRDAQTNESLPGANIILDGTNSGTVTNFDGEYFLSNLPEGLIKLNITYIGYRTETVEVNIIKDIRNEFNVQLSSDAIGISEVVVSSQLLGQKKAINQQLNSDALVNIVSSDKIKELPDVNAAEAIGRISGVSVQRSGGEASKVFLRGLSPELTSITINGVKVPSTGTNDRSVDLSTISPELLSHIEVYKSPTADMDGDAIGGIISLGLSKAPDRRVISARVYTGYNGLDKELSNYKGSIDVSNRFLKKKLGVSIKANFENINRSSESATTGWDNTDTTQFTVNSLNLVDQYRILQRLGLTSQFDYQYKTGNVFGQFFYSQRNTDNKNMNNNINNSGVITHTPSHTQFNTSTTQLMINGEQRFNWLDINWLAARSITSNDNYYDVRMEITQLSGVDVIDDPLTPEILFDRQNYNYVGSFLQKYYWEPSLVEQINNTFSIDLKANFKIGNYISGFVKAGGKYKTENRVMDHDYQIQNWYYLDPDIRRQAVDLWPHPMDLGGLTGDMILISNFADMNASNSIWDNYYSIKPDYNFDTIDQWQEAQKSTLSPQYEDESLKYSTQEHTQAAYMMSKINVGNWLTLIPGVRYEGSDNAYTGRVSSLDQNASSGSVFDTTVYVNYAEILPSVHMKVKPLDWIDLRLSAVKTIARPNYNMIIPRARIDLTNGKLSRGNPDLKHAVAWNYDASVSVYSNKLGLFTIGAFYKKFDNYFTNTERVMSKEEALSHGYPAAVYDVTQDYINFDDSKVYGIEMDFQTNLSYLPKPFNGIVMNFNATRLWSETQFPRYQKITYYDRKLRRDVVDIEKSYFIFDTNKLPDQVDWQANYSIGYDYHGFSIRISAIYQLYYLTSFSAQAEAETAKYVSKYADSFLKFDASISQKLGDHFKIMCNLSNITNESERGYVYLSKYQTNENRYGRTIDFGVQYKF